MEEEQEEEEEIVLKEEKEQEQEEKEQNVKTPEELTPGKGKRNIRNLKLRLKIHQDTQFNISKLTISLGTAWL